MANFVIGLDELLNDSVCNQRGKLGITIGKAHVDEPARSVAVHPKRAPKSLYRRVLSWCQIRLPAARVHRCRVRLADGKGHSKEANRHSDEIAILIEVQLADYNGSQLIGLQVLCLRFCIRYRVRGGTLIQ